MPLIEKLQLVESTHSKISIRRQCALLQVNRSTYYHQPYKQPLLDQEDIWLMRQIDKIYTEFPYYGSRKIAKHLTRQLERAINRKRIGRLMRTMGIEAVYPKPNLSKPAPGHQVYPYLLKGIKASHPNHIWGTDITYIPVKGSWLYLVAILDWYSRYIISWELSDSLAVGFCIQGLKQALDVNIPGIHNSDQGSQFTANEYLELLQSYPQISISMDGRGRCMDNIFTERLWRSVKHEEVYLHDYQSPAEARTSLTRYIYQYNNQRLHEALGYLPPVEVYSGSRIINNQKLS